MWITFGEMVQILCTKNVQVIHIDVSLNPFNLLPKYVIIYVNPTRVINPSRKSGHHAEVILFIKMEIWKSKQKLQSL